MSKQSPFPVRVKDARTAAATWDVLEAGKALTFYNDRVQEIVESISRGKASRVATAQPVDADWLARAEIALGASKALVRIAHDRVCGLGGKTLSPSSQTWSREFVKAARALLPKDRFEAIAHAADTAVS